MRKTRKKPVVDRLRFVAKFADGELSKPAIDVQLQLMRQAFVFANSDDAAERLRGNELLLGHARDALFGRYQAARALTLDRWDTDSNAVRYASVIRSAKAQKATGADRESIIAVARRHSSVKELTRKQLVRILMDNSALPWARKRR